MSLEFRFAIASDLHIGLPHTIQDKPQRFHLVEVSIPALEVVLAHLSQLNLDFLLLPGDLTQHGEPENHRWLANRLAQLPFPVYLIPGNHDVPVATADGYSIGFADFPGYYRKFGYQDPQKHYYTCELLPGVRLISLNSNGFDPNGKQIGAMDAAQLLWLEEVLAQNRQELVLVMIHHNVLEHLPGQTRHAVGQRYMLANASDLLGILRRAGVPLVFTGHLHVQDIAYQQGIYDITTGSLVSYPHPYRICHYFSDRLGRRYLQVDSRRVEAVPDYPQLQEFSREWMGDRSIAFMTKFLLQPPLNLPLHQAQLLAPRLRYFWAAIAAGDPVFDFPEFPDPLRRYFEAFSHAPAPAGEPRLQDNQITLEL